MAALKKRATSAVWEYYTQTTQGKAVCKTCKVGVSMGSTSAKATNTSNLWSHLRIHHPGIYGTAQGKRESESQQGTMTPTQPTMHDMFEKQKKWPSSDNRSIQMDKLITEMIVTDNRPFTLVSDVGFKRLMAPAEPRYALKNEKYYRTVKLYDVHHKVVEKIKALIQPENAGHSLSFTTDCWSGSTESLMTLTCHFIDNAWTRKQVVLNTKAMHGSHTGEYIGETFLGMLDDWKISKDRVALLLRDSGATMVKGMRLAELPDLSCTAHSLQLVVIDGLSSQRAVIDVTAMLKKCATHFHHSILAKQRLRAFQKDLGLPEHNLVQAAGEHGGFACPNSHQWDIVSNLVETLIPIEEVTLEVSHNNSSASCIIPCLTVLKMLFQGEGPTTQGIRTLRQVMRESLDKRFSKLEETKMVVLACLLDPCYKNHVFSSDATLTKAKEWLKEDVTSQEEPAATDESTRKSLLLQKISVRKSRLLQKGPMRKTEEPPKGNGENRYLVVAVLMTCSVLF
ncbi:Zinc finger BED domain containing protein 4 [Dissostichus eleginoides]|uniref:Zinc finger BED domain containing protein 4 n=1 Tax=Dissostichus eleginoides TaxID=100907 RepID=A0AAD9CIV9_DISEL|nr:Zinc finger BED domain containing protein 4 [Dissostichus eleginoides]